MGKSPFFYRLLADYLCEFIIKNSYVHTDMGRVFRESKLKISDITETGDTR